MSDQPETGVCTDHGAYDPKGNCPGCEAENAEQQEEVVDNPMQLWVIYHHHKHGHDLFPILAQRLPTKEEALAVVESFEESEEEWIEVEGPFNPTELNTKKRLIQVVCRLQEGEWDEVIEALNTKIALIERGDYIDADTTEEDSKKWADRLKGIRHRLLSDLEIGVEASYDSGSKEEGGEGNQGGKGERV